MNLNGRVQRLEKTVPPTFADLYKLAFAAFGKPTEGNVKTWADEHREAIWHMWDKKYGRDVWRDVYRQEWPVIRKVIQAVEDGKLTREDIAARWPNVARDWL